jgi:hypothetical protein
MSSGKVEGPAGTVEVVEEALERGAREADPAEVAEADSRLEELLDKVADPPVSQAPADMSTALAPGALAGVAMRTAQPVALHGRTVSLRVRGAASEVTAELGPGVEAEVVKQAVTNGDVVIVECVEGETPLVVGVLQRRLPREINLKARKIHIEGDEEVLLRSGRGAMRIRQDGDVELVGSRIAAMSRGLFRLVGRVLRLN